MKKALVYTMTLCAVLLGFTACNDDNDALTDSTLTTYPHFTMLGDEFTEVNLGDEYVDAGCTATLDGVDITSQIVTTGLEDIDTSVAGFYYVTYSFVNKDGYKKSVTRTVAVFDPNVTTDLSGDYVCASGSICTILSSGGKIDLSGCTISLEQLLPGLFNVSDLMGGLYDQYAGYGADAPGLYVMQGVIQLTADNEIIILNGYVPAWEDSYDEAYPGTYNPETGAVSWGIDYAGLYHFDITIVPVTEEE